MAVNLETQRFISPAIRAQLVRRASELSAIVIALIALSLALALFSYNSADSSFDTVGVRPVGNIAGYMGATIADLLLQSFGIAAFIPILVLLAWAYRLGMRGHIGRLKARTILIGISMPLTAVALAMAIHALSDLHPAWPVAAGPGGAVGEIVSRLLMSASMSVMGRLGGGIVLLATGLFAFLSFGFALGFTPREWQSGGRRAIFAASVSVRHGKRGAVVVSSWLSPLVQTASSSNVSSASIRAWEIESDGAQKPSEEDLYPEEAIKALPFRTKKPAKAITTNRRTQPQQQSLPFLEAGWELPALDLLRSAPPKSNIGPTADGLKNNARLLETVLQDFGVQGRIVEIRPGPVVTLYELEPAPGIRAARVIGLAEDIARSLSVIAVRIAVVAGRNVIGIEVPNGKRETVYLSELLSGTDWGGTNGVLSLALGKDISGAPVVADLSRMPHLLIAGTTGSGKSVGVNAMIMSLLFKLSPEQCRLIMIDPKILELSVYDGIPHLLTPVVTEPAKAVMALKWVVREMDRRYRAMSQLSVRNISGYNDRVNEARTRGEVVTRRVQTGFDSETGKPVFEEQPLALEPLPFIVVFIDEMADLMLAAGKDIEICVQRLAQKARAAGIHVIMATQRPSVDVITGTIKANFPTRISFQVISKFDSRTILGEQGAEQLLGQGDLLYMAGGGRITRVHGPFVSDQEVEAVVEYLREQGAPNYLDEVTEPAEDEESITATGGVLGGGESNGENQLYDQAVAIVARDRKASTSYLQRCLTIGYNRAAKLIEQMEREGVISPANHVGKREVLVRAERDDD